MELSSKFAQSIREFLERGDEMRAREIWLVQRKERPNKKKHRYNDGRTFTEVRDYYEELKSEYVKMEHPVTILNQMQGYFDDSTSRWYVESIRKSIDSFLICNNQDDLKYLSSRIDSVSDTLIDHLSLIISKDARLNGVGK